MKFLVILLTIGFIYADLNPTSFVNTVGDKYKKVILLKTGPVFSKDAGIGIGFAANYSLILDETTLAGIEVSMVNNGYERTVVDGTYNVFQEYEAFYFPITFNVSHKLPLSIKNRLYPVVGFGLGYSFGYNFDEGLTVKNDDGTEITVDSLSKKYDDNGGLNGLTWKIITGGILKLGTRTDLFVNLNYVSANFERMDMSGITLWTGLLFNMR